MTELLQHCKICDTRRKQVVTCASSDMKHCRNCHKDHKNRKPKWYSSVKKMKKTANTYYIMMNSRELVKYPNTPENIFRKTDEYCEYCEAELYQEWVEDEFAGWTEPICPLIRYAPNEEEAIKHTGVLR